MQTGFPDYIKYLTLNQEPSWWNNIYFISFFFITNLVFLNILIGLICDATGAMIANEEAKGEEEGGDEIGTQASGDGDEGKKNA